MVDIQNTVRYRGTVGDCNGVNRAAATAIIITN
jgi:hypothetical protein